MSRVRWVPLAEQPKIDGPLAAALSEDHYARKNLGYLLALESGAGLIFDTDDDNLPLPGWTPPVPVCDAELVAGGPFVNVYAAWPRVAAGGGGDDRAARVWPRGFPLDRLGPEAEPTRTPGPGVRVGVWQGLADLDPDVDAIHRLVFGAGVRFSRGEPAALGPGSWCPFNSQATAWTPGTIDLAYLPFTVSMRWTDILRGYVAQRLLWERGLCVGFYGPAVEQRRNEHDLIDDLAAEIEMYTSVRTVVRVLESIELRGLRGTDQLRAAYEALHAAGVVGEAELRGVAAWSAALKARAAGATPAARPAA